MISASSSAPKSSNPPLAQGTNQTGKKSVHTIGLLLRQRLVDRLTQNALIRQTNTLH